MEAVHEKVFNLHVLTSKIGQHDALHLIFVDEDVVLLQLRKRIGNGSKIRLRVVLVADGPDH